MYSGYLDSVYENTPGIKNLTYEEHLNKLFIDATDFTGSYIKNFKKLGLQASALISNDKLLQQKWLRENGLKNEENILFEQVRKFDPEVLWIDNMSLVDEQWIQNVRNRQKRLKLVIGYHCSPLNSRVLKCLKGVDLVITCTPGLKTIFESAGKKSYLVYHAFDPDTLNLIDRSKAQVHDLLFSGSLTTGDSFHSERIHLVEKILENNIGIDLYANLEKTSRIRIKQSIFTLNSILKKAGLSRIVDNNSILQYGRTRISNYSEKLLKRTKPPVYGAEMYNLLFQSGIVLNYHIGVAGDYAGNMRMFETTGVGSCLLTDNKKNMSELFDVGNEVVVYDNADDCIEKIKWLLDHDDERKKIATAGQNKTLASHLVEDRCKTVFDIIDSEIKSRQTR
jgi:spore maturation protein CgeB